MMYQNLEGVKTILLKYIQAIEEDLLAISSQDDLKRHLENGTRDCDDGKVEAYLSYYPSACEHGECIDLIFSLSCSQQKTIFVSEIVWSGGKKIDVVTVCEMCSDCLEALDERMEHLMAGIQAPLVAQIVSLLSNFN